MDYKKFTLGVGPISKDIVNICLEYSHRYQFPLYIIPSRNQANYNSGYAFTTVELVKYIKNHPFYNKDLNILCRDHCGPYFSDRDKNLSLQQAMDETVKTITCDILNGFSIIHIDVGRVPNQYKFTCADTLFQSSIKLNPNIKFEFGSEDNLGTTNSNLSILNENLEFLKKYKDNTVYVVTQTGSLTKHKQVGTFEIEKNLIATNLVHSKGFYFKEHNADYLSKNDIIKRKQAGIDALNIAPQLGRIQSELLYKFAKNNYKFNNFVKKVLDSKKYEQWITTEINDNDTKFFVSGHYLFNEEEYKILLADINIGEYKDILKNNIFEVLTDYRLGMT